MHGVRDIDSRLKAMLDLKFTCRELGYSYPPELIEAFGEDVLEFDAREDIIKAVTEVDLGGRNWRTRADGKGCELVIDLSELPDGISKIRVFTE